MPVEHDVGPEDMLQAGQMCLVTDLRRPVLLVRSANGAYHAVHPLCPHHGVNLSGGRLSGHFLPSEVGEYVYEDTAEVVRCPRHGYEFDVKTGRSCFLSDLRIKSFPIRVVSGRVMVEL
jgi:nitrite reductase/ring-hydroxylating ferredoxin subunit